MKFYVILIKILFLSVLVLLSWHDWKHKKIPNRYIFTLVLLGTCNYMLQMGNIQDGLIGAGIVSIPMLLINLQRNRAFGGGDIKLSATAGWFLGWRACINGWIYGLFAAAGYGLCLLFCRKATLSADIPLGPFLSAGWIAVYLTGDLLYFF